MGKRQQKLFFTTDTEIHIHRTEEVLGSSGPHNTLQFSGQKGYKSPQKHGLEQRPKWSGPTKQLHTSETSTASEKTTGL